MSSSSTGAAPAIAAPQPARPSPRKRFRAGALVAVVFGLAIAAAAMWGAWRGYRALTAPQALNIPTARVKLGDVNFDVHAQGTLKGGRSDMLVAPPVSGALLSIKRLSDPGDLVQPGDVIAEFDTSTQEYNLTQAQEALDQAKQQVIQAKATADAQTEDDSYQMIKAQYDVKRAELQVQSNPILASLVARKNDLTLAVAREHVRQLQADIAGREASNAAAVATQQAAVAKAEADAATARNNIAAMTLKAEHAGYVAIQPNSSAILFYGMPVPPFQVGDTARPGLAIAEIPDTGSWAVTVNVSEVDAGYLTPGQPVRVDFVALPGQTFAGKLQTVGAASGYGWDRQVSCNVELLQSSAALHPGLSANVTITTETVPRALWAPSQAVFESGGHSYVYRRDAGGFERHDISVLRRSESQVIVSGLRAGDEIALSNPELAAATRSKPTGAAAALPGRGQ